VETKLSSKKSTKPTKSLETNLNVDSTITTEAEVVDSEGEVISVDLDDLVAEVDLTSVMSLVTCLVVDLDDEEDLVSVKEMISSKHSPSHLKKHTSELPKKSDTTDELWLNESKKKPVLPVMGTERFFSRHRHHFESCKYRQTALAVDEQGRHIQKTARHWTEMG